MSSSDWLPDSKDGVEKMTMTPEEALAAVKRAVEELLPVLERECEDIVDGEFAYLINDEAKAALALLRAIAPGGPLVVVPREPTKEMCEAGLSEAFMDEESGVETIYRAMIAEVK